MFWLLEERGKVSRVSEAVDEILSWRRRIFRVRSELAVGLFVGLSSNSDAVSYSDSDELASLADRCRLRRTCLLISVESSTALCLGRLVLPV